jgi:acyl dehydratase
VRRYFEDFHEGQEIELGSWQTSAAEIIEFAREWDPQYFHIDAEAARSSLYGGLIATGWQSAFAWMQLYAETVLTDAAPLGGGSVDELRWFLPTRPDEIFHARLVVVETSPDGPDGGTVRLRGELRNDAGELAFRLLGQTRFARRGRSA